MRITNSTRGTTLASCAEIADTPAKRRLGLLNRESLAPGEGLWLSSASAIHTFGMKFPIDVLFLDPQGSVLGILPNMGPEETSGRYPYCKVASVLELPAGTAEATGTREGDNLSLELPVSNIGESFTRLFPVLAALVVCVGFVLVVSR